jgi:hypothetical protein
MAVQVGRLRSIRYDYSQARRSNLVPDEKEAADKLVRVR